MSPTHEVLNQPPPLAGYDLYEADPVLAEAVRREGAGWASERLLALTELTGQSEAGLEDLFDDVFYLHLLAATGIGELDPEELAGEGSVLRRVERATGTALDRYRPARYLLNQQQRLLPAIGREPLHRFARLFATLDEL